MSEITLILSTLIFILIFYYLIGFIQMRLTKWWILVNLFNSQKEPQGEIYYGAQSEFKSAHSNYPFSNSAIKYIPNPDGLFVKHDLLFEWPKHFKPVLIPWVNLFIMKATQWEQDGYDKYQIYYEDNYLGQLKVSPYISEQILKYVEKNKIEVTVK